MENNLIALYEPTAIELITAEKLSLQTLADEAKKVLEIEITDTKTYDIVSAKQTELQKRRKSIEDARLDFTRVLDQKKDGAMSIQRDLTGIISDIEDKLKEKKKAYNELQEKIKAEKERQEQARVQIRVDELAKYGYSHDLFDLRHMSDTDFNILQSSAKSVFEFEESKRQVEEERIQKEREDFEKKKAEQEAKDKEFADREAAIKAAEDKIKADELAKTRAEELKQAQEEAAEKAKKDTEARMKKEQEEKEQKEAHDRLIKKQAEEFEQKQLEKKKKYQAWLAEHSATNADEIRKTEDGKKIVLWRKISEFII